MAETSLILDDGMVEPLFRTGVVGSGRGWVNRPDIGFSSGPVWSLERYGDTVMLFGGDIMSPQEHLLESFAVSDCLPGWVLRSEFTAGGDVLARLGEFDELDSNALLVINGGLPILAAVSNDSRFAVSDSVSGGDWEVLPVHVGGGLQLDGVTVERVFESYEYPGFVVVEMAVAPDQVWAYGERCAGPHIFTDVESVRRESSAFLDRWKAAWDRLGRSNRDAVSASDPMNSEDEGCAH